MFGNFWRFENIEVRFWKTNSRVKVREVRSSVLGGERFWKGRYFSVYVARFEFGAWVQWSESSEFGHADGVWNCSTQHLLKVSMGVTGIVECAVSRLFPCLVEYNSTYISTESEVTVSVNYQFKSKLLIPWSRLAQLYITDTCMYFDTWCIQIYHYLEVQSMKCTLPWLYK